MAHIRNLTNILITISFNVFKINILINGSLFPRSIDSETIIWLRTAVVQVFLTLLCHVLCQINK